MTHAEGYKAWLGLRNTVRDADTKMLKLFAHPECTDEMILQAARAIGEVHRDFDKSTKALIEMLYKKGHATMAKQLEEEA